MRPRPEVAHDDFRVFVYASFIPLHGLEHVVRAAAILEKRGEPVSDRPGRLGRHRELRACVDGAARCAQHHVRRPATVRRAAGVDGAQRPVPRHLRHVTQGATGHPEQGLRRARPASRAVITGDTPAVRELLRPGDDVWVCPPGDPEALADAIATLRRDDDLRRAIAERGHARFREAASLDALARDLAAIVGELL